MPQLSKRNVKTKVKNKAYSLLINQLAKAKTPQSADTLVQSLFTETEKVMFAKRMAAMLMIAKKANYEDISSTIKISHNTISRLKKQLHHSPESFKKSLEKLARSDAFKNLLVEIGYNIEKILPPASGDWSKWRGDLEKFRIGAKEPF